MQGKFETNSNPEKKIEAEEVINEQIPEAPEIKSEKLPILPNDKEAIEHVRSELQAAENSNAEVVKNPNEEAAIANVRSSYVYLMTHPYSIDSLRDSEERLKLDLQALEEIIGEEKANNILDNLKRELAPSFKGRTTPKIKYDGILDKFTDIVRTKISDWWD
ncbi:MAG: hypothetical protein K0S38_778 [Candidatus Paceibacter sp.]|jgi:hypothetical protein|nr:hypothetical protein [Candidatus Paceibacter sp.]